MEGHINCLGGWPISVFNYSMYNNLCSEFCYPYTGTEVGGCVTSNVVNCEVKAGISHFYQLPAKNDQALKSQVAKQPVSVVIDASSKRFQFYLLGVYKDKHCNHPAEQNHAVLVAGYGTTDEFKENYWLVKNSWGELWGEQGYIKMSRETPNTCGISQYAFYPGIEGAH